MTQGLSVSRLPGFALNRRSVYDIIMMAMEDVIYHGITRGGPAGAVADDFILLEDGFVVLLEDGGKMVKEIY